jgi:hypothetical protein
MAKASQKYSLPSLEWFVFASFTDAVDGSQRHEYLDSGSYLQFAG